MSDRLDAVELMLGTLSEPWPWRGAVPFGFAFHITAEDAAFITRAPGDIAYLLKRLKTAENAIAELNDDAKYPLSAEAEAAVADWEEASNE